MNRLLAVVALALATASCGDTGTPIANIEVGHCFNDPDAEFVSSLEVVDCAGEHDNEVYAEVFITTTAYPGDEAVYDFAIDSCLVELEPYVGVSYAESSLDYTYIGLTDDAWEEGARSILCVLYSPDLAKLIGSQRAG